MGLFDKIKDNAKTISMKALEATREYDDDYQPQQPAPETTIAPTAQDDAVFLIDEEVETPVESEAAQPEEKEPEVAEKETEPEEKEVEKPRKSKVTEISKEEHEKAEKEKEQEKAKQAAKERLAKSYTPSYKANKAAAKVEVKEESEKSEAKKPATPQRQPVGIVDITPKKFQDPLKQAIYARERAALTALASQRKLNGTVPLYVANHMNFKTRVFINRIEYSGSFGKNVIPIEQVAWVKLRHAGTGIIIETTEGKRIVMVVKPSDRLAFADAILKVQAMQPKKGKIKDTQTVRIDQLEQFGNSVDEIEKLAKLYDKGILSQDEFEAKKKQLLGI